MVNRRGFFGSVAAAVGVLIPARKGLASGIARTGNYPVTLLSEDTWIYITRGQQRYSFPPTSGNVWKLDEVLAQSEAIDAGVNDCNLP